MRMQFKPIYIIGITVGLLVVIADLYFFLGKDDLTGAFGVKSNLFYPLLIIAFNIMWSQFWIDFLKELQRQKRIEEKFLDFVRSLEGNIKSGISIPRSILQSSNESFSELDPYIQKLANQMVLGIPINKAFMTFSEDTDNPTVKRAVGIIIEAEMSGGDIVSVLESVTDSIVTQKEMHEERKSSMYSQIIQGYAVFLIFIGIMVMLQKKLFPQLGEMAKSLGGAGALSFAGLTLGGSGTHGPFLDKMFFALIIIQGIFAGIMIGKFAEGKIRNGLIHSVVLVTLAILIMTGAGVFGGVAGP